MLFRSLLEPLRYRLGPPLRQILVMRIISHIIGMTRDRQIPTRWVKKASKVLDGVARKTDLIYSPALSGENQIYLKTENLQLTGSFKLRGAYNMISNMSEEDKAKGLVACSAGNHAQGVALASKRNGLKCIICMPSKAPISKVEAKIGRAHV